MFLSFSFGISPGDLGEAVDPRQNHKVLAFTGDLGAAVLGEKNLVTLEAVERDALAVVVELALADREHLALLRLLLRRVGKNDAGGRSGFLLDGLDDQAIAQGL